MGTWWISLRAAIALSLIHPDDRQLAVALASIGSSPTSLNPPESSGGFGTPSSHPDGADPDGDDPEGSVRIRALVDLARDGDAEAFGQLYDHYVTGVYRLAYYRLGTKQLAEDITAETFVRALRSINSFTWQGKDFGAWLTTIARNLITDHYKSSRQRLELVVDAVPEQTEVTPGPEAAVLASLSSAELMRAVQALPPEQRDCVLMRFMEGLSIAETAQVLDRSEGAIKQLQLRAIRNLAKSLTRGD